MSLLISLGAINKATGRYEIPKFADKRDKHSCPDCKKDVFLRKGEKRKAHFAHYASTDPCTYYTRLGESDVHRHAKEMMKYVLTHLTVTIDRHCLTCREVIQSDAIPALSEGSEIHLEYAFEHTSILRNSRLSGPKIADVAYTKGDGIAYLFEIYHSHKTGEGERPDPWYELSASTLIETVENCSDNTIRFNCMRAKDCESCVINRFEYLKDKTLQWFSEHPVEFDWFVRYKVGQREFNPLHDQDHLRFNMDEQGHDYNSTIVNCFKDYLAGEYVTVPSHEGSICYTITDHLITSKKEYYERMNSYDYGDRYEYTDGECCSGDGTIEILKKLLMKCLQRQTLKLKTKEETIIFMDVPFERKDEAKKWGARWDGEKKKWYTYYSNKFKQELLKQFRSISG